MGHCSFLPGANQCATDSKAVNRSNNMSQVPAVTKDKLLNEFNTVVAETEQLLKSVASLSSDQAGMLKGNVDQALSSASDQVMQIRDQSVAQAKAAALATEEYVKENPWRAVGIVAFVAAAAGLVSGVLIARR
jgi:ElaB/YqjD/DUF883 family membrane-anchored ribosome-binding protein